MKNIIIAGFLLLSLTSLAFLKSKKDNPEPVVELPTKPWVVVSSPSVSVLFPDGSIMKELTTGDSLDYPVTLYVGKEGRGAIHFLDGSVLRLDSNTKITLNEGTYDKANGKISVRVNLALGKVWSKVIELATPDSVWEVRTSNAVATVRGTAFGMGTDGDRSKMFGSEHRVAVKALDPKTGKEVGKEPVILDEGKLLEWNNDDVELFKTNKKVILAVDIKTSAASASLVKDEDRGWINDNESEDIKIQAEVEDLKARGLKRPEVREEIIRKFRKEIEEKRENKEGIKIEAEKRADDDKEANIKRDNVEIKKDVKVEIRKDEPVRKPIIKEEVRVDTTRDVNTTIINREINSSIQRPVPKELIIESNVSLLKNLVEETRNPFRAILIFSDGKRQDVTDIVEWKVLGPVGSINKSGVFVGRLAPEVSELGEASGAVTAIWRDGDKELFAKTPIFKVEFKIDTDIDTRG